MAQSLSDSYGKRDGEAQSIALDAAVVGTTAHERVCVRESTRAGEGPPRGSATIPSPEFKQTIIPASELVGLIGC